MRKLGILALIVGLVAMTVPAHAEVLQAPTPDIEQQHAIRAEGSRIVWAAARYAHVVISNYLEAITPPTPKPKAVIRRTTGGTVTGTQSGIPSGGCSGGILPDYIYQRESRGRCDAVNATGCGGRGCIGDAQVDRGHFYADSPWGSGPGSCYGLDYQSCVYKLSNGGTNLAPWRCC